MISKWLALAVYILFGLSESAFVDTLSKCAIKDAECQKNFIQNIIVNYSQSGIPEYEIPPFDPFQYKNVTIPLLGLLSITIEDGESAGAKDCIINSYTPNIENGFNEVEVTCDFMVKIKYIISGSNTITDKLFEGKTIHGDGNGELKLEKLHVGLKLFYDLVKKDDGEIYFSFRFNNTEYIYDLQNFHTTFDKIFVGEEDVSDRFKSFINENWKFIINSFGKTIFDVALNLLNEILNKVFSSIPASKVISDDLTPYLKNK